MIRFPYGMADFRQIITEGYFYCDRSPAILYLERGKTGLVIRPRRFGKSLTLSIGGQGMIFALARRDSSVVIPGLSKRFGLSDMLSDQSKDRAFIASFLYYFGVLTLAGETENLQTILKVPNLVMQGLYVDRVRLLMLPDPVIRDEDRLAAGKAYQEGDVGLRRPPLARKCRDLKLKRFVVVALGFERICFLNAADLERKVD